MRNQRRGPASSSAGISTDIAPVTSSSGSAHVAHVTRSVLCSPCHDQPALGGVYKLSALANAEGELVPSIKLSELAIKVSLPGRLGAKRLMRGDTPVCDVLVDLDHSGISLSLCAMATGEPIPTPEHDRVVDLSVPVMRAGKRVGTPPALSASRDLAKRELSVLPAVLTALTATGEYPVYLEAYVARSRAELMAARRPVKEAM